MKLIVFVTCFLKNESGTLDYREMFTPMSFISSVRNRPMHRNPSNQNIHPLMMNILSWNVIGATRANFRRVFRELVSTHRPDVVIIIETRVSGDIANKIIATLGFERYIKVDVMGFSRGIWVLWNPNVVYMEPMATPFKKSILNAG